MFAGCWICVQLQPEREHGRVHLHGLFRRKAGSVGNLTYSPAMKASGVIWNEETLAKYICDLKALSRQPYGFSGHQKRQIAHDPLAYLK